MLRRNFDMSPRTRLLQASVLIAFATGTMMLVIATEFGRPRIATETTGSIVRVVP